MYKFQKLFNSKNLNTKEPFVIAEIGHNHKGSVEIAKELFTAAKNANANAVKLQKRDNAFLYTKEFYNQKYNSENSYGKTYGIHREALEFGRKEYRELIKFAKKLELEFLCTPFDFKSLKFLEELNLKAYKIASADLINIPLQKKLHIVGQTNYGLIQHNIQKMRSLQD